jgi:hypothetical protein
MPLAGAIGAPYFVRMNGFNGTVAASLAVWALIGLAAVALIKFVFFY